MNQQLITTTLNEMPDKETFNATLWVRYVPLDLGSIIILTGLSSNMGKSITWGIEYYAPAVASKLGLKVEYCHFFIHSPVIIESPELAARLKLPPEFDATYMQVNVSSLMCDDYQRLCADRYTLTEPSLKMASLLEKYLNQPLTKHLGRPGVFYTQDADTLVRKISAYDGKNYYVCDSQGQHQKIKGQLVGFDDE